MNLDDVLSPMRRRAFQTWRSLICATPGAQTGTFGTGPGQVSAILVINLDRQPRRWRRVTRELRRIRKVDGTPLTTITRRLAAVDARDGREVAATADVDVMYRIGDQLHVQPDARLRECFPESEPVRMTRQEVAVARSHVEAWKAIANGADCHVLVLEDDAWFKSGAAATIDRGWRAALNRSESGAGPHLLYLSYVDAGGTALRTAVCDDLFRPVRGLWHLSGYVLSRDGAAALLRALPVVGPVDLWMNYRFAELDALALALPAIAQRPDGASDNVYSVLPYLARAGIVDGLHADMAPDSSAVPPVLAYAPSGDCEGLAMALSMLGLRVRALDGDEGPLDERELAEAFKTFDALVNAPLTRAAAGAVAGGRSMLFVGSGAVTPVGIEPKLLKPSRTTTLTTSNSHNGSWEALCSVLGVAKPVEAYPAGAPRESRLFRDDRSYQPSVSPARVPRKTPPLDDSPWVLPTSCYWRPRPGPSGIAPATGQRIVQAPMSDASPSFVSLVETFPGNLAAFARDGLEHSAHGTHLILDAIKGGPRPYQSGAFASAQVFSHGRFEAEIKAAPGPGLVTGFFLHRDAPRQEIDIEFMGVDPRGMLTNVFFNPGDEGTTMSFGYRGAPSWIHLDFDATKAFHVYAIDWQPDRVTWLVDGKPVHERVSWDPTPIPHLNMRLHANLWAPRSKELAGRIDESALPAAAAYRNVVVTTKLP